MSVYDLVIVGAGPAGLAASIAAKGHGLSHVVLEKGAVVDAILHFPLNMVFFATPELLEIGNLPFVTPYESRRGSKRCATTAVSSRRSICRSKWGRPSRR